MSYPLIIRDNFFPDPDAIVKESNKLQYYSSENNWPGLSTNPLNEVNPKLFAYTGLKIFHLLHDATPETYTMMMEFRKINSSIEGDKWNRKNRGWIHRDCCLFGGVIYLDKNPDKDAGTGIYKSKDGYDVQTNESMAIKEDHFAGKQIDDEKFNRGYDIIENQYEETLRIPNLYNRLVLIPGDQPHSMTTIGDKERNTLVFFCRSVGGVFTPEYKSHISPIPNHVLHLNT